MKTSEASCTVSSAFAPPDASTVTSGLPTAHGWITAEALDVLTEDGRLIRPPGPETALGMIDGLKASLRVMSGI
jgi:hypothetical protein